MADRTLNARQKQKYDTSTNWTTNNPVLLAGEIGVESDTNKMKVGDGSTSWTSLQYIKSDSDNSGTAVTVGTEQVDTLTFTSDPQTQINNLSNNKVDKIDGKGLSTNDYTNEEKSKLAGIEAGAEVNPTSLSELAEDSTHRLVTDAEKATWNAKSDFSGSYNDLTDKPTIPTATSDLTNDSNFVSDSSYVHTDNNYTSAEKDKLASIESGAQANDPIDNALSTTSENAVQNKVVTETINNIVNNTTKIVNSGSGFAAGANASAGGGGAIGYNAGASVGGAIGYNASADFGGAIGLGASATNGGAVGANASATNGGAVGYNTKTSIGFAGGYNARTVDSNNDAIDAIQLGTGTNNTGKTLQVYNDNIYNANTHTLTAENLSLTAGTPYIDFHTDGSANTDYNARIKAAGSQLEIEAGGGLKLNNSNLMNLQQFNGGFVYTTTCTANGVTTIDLRNFIDRNISVTNTEIYEIQFNIAVYAQNTRYTHLYSDLVSSTSGSTRGLATSTNARSAGCYGTIIARRYIYINNTEGSMSQGAFAILGWRKLHE